MLRVVFNYSFVSDGQNTVSFSVESYLTLLGLRWMKYAVNGSHYLQLVVCRQVPVSVLMKAKKRSKH